MIKLKAFKKLRQYQGTFNALMLALIRSGVPTVKASHAIQGLLEEYSIRHLEKTKSKDLYDFVDGFVNAYKDKSCVMQEFVLTK